MQPSYKVAQRIVSILNGKECDDLTFMKLNSLVYFCHGWMLSLVNLPLISEDIYARRNGPIIPELLRDIGARETHISKTPTIFKLSFTNEEENIIQQVCQNYFYFKENSLLAMITQKNSPYDIMRSRFYFTENTGKIIPNKLIKESFDKIKKIGI